MPQFLLIPGLGSMGKKVLTKQQHFNDNMMNNSDINLHNYVI